MKALCALALALAMAGEFLVSLPRLSAFLKRKEEAGLPLACR
jgi:hypothetical protein